MIASASRCAAARRSPAGSGRSTRAIRSSAQCRLTAVGRVAASTASACSSAASSAAACSAMATPQAAVAPISGAPRTCMRVIALATLSSVYSGQTTR